MVFIQTSLAPPPIAHREHRRSHFAGESQLDDIARKLDLDPVEFRLKNMRVEGDPVPAGPNEPKVGYKETLQAVADAVDWKNRTTGTESRVGCGNR